MKEVEKEEVARRCVPLNHTPSCLCLYLVTEVEKEVVKEVVKEAGIEVEVEAA